MNPVLGLVSTTNIAGDGTWAAPRSSWTHPSGGTATCYAISTYWHYEYIGGTWQSVSTNADFKDWEVRPSVSTFFLAFANSEGSAYMIHTYAVKGGGNPTTATDMTDCNHP